MKKLLLAVAIVTLLPIRAMGAEINVLDANAKIRLEATGHSQVMRILHVLSDRYRSRETGSPGLTDAARWTIEQMKGWGLKNAHLENWDFGHPGWENVRAEACLLAPEPGSLDVRVPSWTQSTKGAVSGAVVQLFPPAGAGASLTAWMKENTAAIQGRIVMLGRASAAAYTLAAQAQTAARGRGGSAPAGGNQGRGTLLGELAALLTGRDPRRGPPGAAPLGGAAETSVSQWLVNGGALARIYDGRGANSVINETHNRTYDGAKAPAAIIVRNEDYGRIERLLADGTEVKMEVNVQNKWYPEGKTCCNVIAEIPGTDKADEVVMMGGHLDDWNMASGAMDNATGVATMMEVARIINAAGLKPRRTIRIALWGGEEEGLLGSRAYVKQHFGSFEEQKPEFAKISAYFNIDMGTGSVRALLVFGTDEARKALTDALLPFADLGSIGAVAAQRGLTGSTDSSSFSSAGITSINMSQTTNDYSLTHHTTLDTYEHGDPDQMIQGVIVCAAEVWAAANRDELLPRYTRQTMPAPGRGR